MSSNFKMKGSKSIVEVKEKYEDFKKRTKRKHKISLEVMWKTS